MPVATEGADQNNQHQQHPQQINLANVLKMLYNNSEAARAYIASSLQPLNGLTVETQQSYPANTLEFKIKDELKSPGQATSSSSSSPHGSAGRSDSPASTIGSLPKEAEHAERKRPLAIQELLRSKKARLDKIKSVRMFLNIRINHF